MHELQALAQAQAAAVSAGDTPRIADASRHLNAELYLLLAELQLARGDAAGAVSLFGQASDQDPSSEQRLEFASALLRAGNATDALTQADAVIAVDPNNAAAWVTRGTALRQAGRNPEAITAFHRAFALQPAPAVQYALGSLYLAIHEGAKAESLFRQLQATSGQSAVWDVAIGDAYRNAGELQTAVRFLNAGIAADPKVPEGEFFLGLTYLQMNEWGPNAESFEHLRKAVALHPHDYLSNFYLGALESTAGTDLAASDRHLQAAAATDPSQPEVWLYLGANANREHRSAEAKTAFRKAIELTGNHEGRNNYQVRRAYFSLGRLLLAEGNRVEGEALLARYKQDEQLAIAESARSISEAGNAQSEAAALRSLAAAAPSPAVFDTPAAAATALPPSAAESQLRKLLASSLNDLGTAQARGHEYGLALKSFGRAAEMDPSDVQVLRNLGTAAFRVGDNVQAAQALKAYQAEQRAAGQSTDSHAQLMLALAEFRLGRFAPATTDFQGAGQDTFQEPVAAYSYAFALARTGQDQEANHVLDKLTTQPLPRELWPLVCHVYVDTENYSGSQTCYRTALAQDAQLPLAHYEIGESLIRLGRPAEAIPELRRELEVRQDDPDVSNALAFALLQTSQKDQARSLLKTTVEHHPEHAEAQYEYGKLLLEDGQLQDSIAHLVMAEKSDASKDFVHYQLGTAYKKTGNTADAEREFRLYRELKDKNRDAHATPH